MLQSMYVLYSKTLSTYKTNKQKNSLIKTQIFSRYARYQRQHTVIITFSFHHRHVLFSKLESS